MQELEQKVHEGLFERPGGGGVCMVTDKNGWTCMRVMYIQSCKYVVYIK